MYYILDKDHEVVECSLEEFALFFSPEFHRDRIVRQEHVGRAWISTVFLCLDHNYCNEGPPILFETIIFPEEIYDHYLTRCSTWDEAVIMHQQARVFACQRNEEIEASQGAIFLYSYDRLPRKVKKGQKKLNTFQPRVIVGIKTKEIK